MAPRTYEQAARRPREWWSSPWLAVAALFVLSSAVGYSVGKQAMAPRSAAPVLAAEPEPAQRPGVATAPAPPPPPEPAVDPQPSIVNPEPVVSAVPEPPAPAPLAITPEDAELRMLAGQVIMAGIPATWSPASPAPLDQVPAGGVILFRPNTQAGSAAIRSTCAALRGYVAKKGAPAPAIAIDHEGGLVNRLKNVKGITPFPSAWAMGQRGERAVYEEGLTMGRELAALGFDLNLAPVVDVIDSPQTSALGNRAFGSDPHKVGALASMFVQGSRAGGTAVCAKHWPGYGPGAADAHTDIVRTNIGEETWSNRYAPPFRYATDSGADAVMVGHAIWSKVFGPKPAVVSPSAYQTLRQFTDVAALTDDLEMAGALSLYNDSIGPLAVDALAAGADMVLVCHTPERVVAAHRAIIDAVRKGTLSREELRAKAQRVARLRMRG